MYITIVSPDITIYIYDNNILAAFPALFTTQLEYSKKFQYLLVHGLLMFMFLKLANRIEERDDGAKKRFPFDIKAFFYKYICCSQNEVYLTAQTPLFVLVFELIKELDERKCVRPTVDGWPI